MHVLETENDLPKYKFSHIFLQLSSSSYIREQITTTAHFHDIHDMIFRFETFIQSHDILLPSSFKYIILLHNFFQRRFILHCFLRDTLQCDKLSRQPMYSQIYFAKCSFTNNFSDLIVLWLRLEHFFYHVVLLIW